MKEYTVTVVDTKNPAVLKFETNHLLTRAKNYEFKNIDEAKDSPLAQQLFYLPFIKTVYISGNFIGLERFDIVQWDDVKDEVAQQLVDYLNAGEPVVIETDSSGQIPVTIYAEATPNPATMRFVANRTIAPSAFEFKNIDEAQVSGLAKKLFLFPFVREVFIDENYVSVSKYEVADWEDITMELREMIRGYVADGHEVVSEAAIHAKMRNPGTETTTGDPLDETSKQIVNILEEYVRPAVASDGGNIVFRSYDPENKTVYVMLQGACSGCPSSTFTLKNGIETMLRNMMGDKISQVVAFNG